MIKAIIFDNNGVLTLSDAEFTIPRLARYFDIDPIHFAKVFSGLVEPGDLGKITTEKFFQNVCEEIDKDFKPNEILSVLKNECYKPRDGMRELVNSLKQDYTVALLTNFLDIFDYFNQNVWHFDGLFDQIFVSSKLGMAKPNADIYQYALKKLNVKAGEAIFIDDRTNNIEAAEKLGIKGVLFKDINQLKSEFDNILTSNQKLMNEKVLKG